MKTLTAILACCLALATLDANAAKRLGGGTSIGKQSSNVTQRQQAAPAPATPANTATATPAPGTPAQAAPAAATAARPAP
ncbi:Tim44 domain-containing protein, partial [Ramlibacter sp. MAHUQ-53]